MQVISRNLVRSSKSLYDFNSILKAVNVFVCLLTVYFYFEEGVNEYVNTFTIILAMAIGLQNICILFYEKRHSNPFIIILVFLTTVFYLTRITTLVSLPLSWTFERDSVTYEDLNYTLIFIFFSNATMFLGFYTGMALRKKKYDNGTTTVYSSKKTRNLILILMIMILLVIVGSMGFSIGGLLDFFVVTFFHSEVVFLFTFTFIAYHYHNIPARVRWSVVLFILVFIFFVTVAGSRSGILTAGYLLLISILVVRQRVRINKILLLSSLIWVPISISLYIVSTFNRSLEIKETNVGSLVSLIKEENVFEGENVNFFLGKIYQRIGFLDYSTDMIKNQKKFSLVINPVYYTQSIIDNVFTPGFDVFGAAKASNTLGPLADGKAIPTRSEAASLELYTSDMMGIYGEYYVMFFGYPALLVIFLITFTFQQIYESLAADTLRNNMYKVLVVSIFFTWMNSFGTDWFVVELVCTVCSAFFLKRFYFSSKETKINVS